MSASINGRRNLVLVIVLAVVGACVWLVPGASDNLSKAVDSSSNYINEKTSKWEDRDVSTEKQVGETAK